MVWYTPGTHPLSGRIEGIEGVFEWLKQSAEVTDGTFRVEMHRILADDEWAAVISTYRRASARAWCWRCPACRPSAATWSTNKVVEARIWVYDDVFVNKFWSA